MVQRAALALIAAAASGIPPAADNDWEIHLIVLWTATHPNASFVYDAAIHSSAFQVVSTRMHAAFATREERVRNMNMFYERDRRNKDVDDIRGTVSFAVVFIRLMRSQYVACQGKMHSHGAAACPPTNEFKAWARNAFPGLVVHGTDTIDESFDNMRTLQHMLGDQYPDSQLLRHPPQWASALKLVQGLNLRSRYVTTPKFECQWLLPDCQESGADILADDCNSVMSTLGGVPTSLASLATRTSRMLSVSIAGKHSVLDVRCVGSGYLSDAWEGSILESRELHSRWKAYVMHPLHFAFVLIRQHALLKNGIGRPLWEALRVRLGQAPEKSELMGPQSLSLLHQAVEQRNAMLASDVLDRFIAWNGFGADDRTLGPPWYNSYEGPVSSHGLWVDLEANTKLNAANAQMGRGGDVFMTEDNVRRLSCYAKAPTWQLGHATFECLPKKANMTIAGVLAPRLLCRGSGCNQSGRTMTNLHARVDKVTRLTPMVETALRQRQAVQQALLQRLLQLQASFPEDSPHAFLLKRMGWTTQVAPRTTISGLLPTDSALSHEHGMAQYMEVSDSVPGRQLNVILKDLSFCGQLGAIHQIAIKLHMLQRTVGFVHFDLAPKNILCERTMNNHNQIGDCILIDFESATISLSPARLTVGRSINAVNRYFVLNGTFAHDEPMFSFDMRFLLYLLHRSYREGHPVRCVQGECASQKLMDWMEMYERNHCNTTRSILSTATVHGEIYNGSQRDDGDRRLPHFHRGLASCFEPGKISAHILKMDPGGCRRMQL